MKKILTFIFLSVLSYSSLALEVGDIVILKKQAALREVLVINGRRVTLKETPSHGKALVSSSDVSKVAEHSVDGFREGDRVRLMQNDRIERKIMAIGEDGTVLLAPARGYNQTTTTTRKIQ